MHLRCEYEIRSAGYRCTVKEIKSNQLNPIEAQGEHVAGKSNLDVKHLEFINIELIAIPRGIGSEFSCTKVLWIQNCNLRQISREDFAGLERLQTLSLKKNRITELSADVFNNLKELKYLSLAFNRLEFVNPKLFEALTELQTLNLQSNRNINKVWKDLTRDDVRGNAMAEIALKYSRPPLAIASREWSETADINNNGRHLAEGKDKIVQLECNNTINVNPRAPERPLEDNLRRSQSINDIVVGKSAKVFSGDLRSLISNRKMANDTLNK